jgi:hypothetical protein
LIVEVHPDPSVARSDADQQLTFAQFSDLMHSISLIATASNRSLRPQMPQMPQMPPSVAPSIAAAASAESSVAASSHDTRRRAVAAA